MNYLKAQLHAFTKKQRKIKLSIRLKFVLKAALTDFQSILDKRENLMTLTIKLKINIKRHDGVITTSNDCSKNFKNARRKSFKEKKKEIHFTNKKFKCEKKNRKIEKNHFLKSFVILVKKKILYFELFSIFKKRDNKN